MVTTRVASVKSVPSGTPHSPGRTVQHFPALVGYVARIDGEVVSNGRPIFQTQTRSACSSQSLVSCSQLESQMQHPIKVRAIMAYGEGFTYRIEDAEGACFNINEAWLCSSASGHELNPCVFCGQGVT